MKPTFPYALLFASCFYLGPIATGLGDAPGYISLSDKLHHLRADGPREWSDFPEQAEGKHLELRFDAAASVAEQTLVLRQQDVKETWRIRLNDKELGRLTIDENDMLLCFAVPPGTLVDGENQLRIEQIGDKPKIDDVRVGHIRIVSQPLEEYLRQATVRVRVLDGDSGKLIPSRITILDAGGGRQTIGAVSNETLAVRPGVVYTASGEAEFGLPAGRYTLYAGRGFEYSLGKSEIEVASGQQIEQALRIRREVPTDGYVACDTHIHTLTHSGHGDATIQERMITLAGEGIELPIATDHNRHIDYEPTARQLGVRSYFTPVMGNEVTTALGHFNVFPVSAAAALPDHRAADWKTIFQGIHRTADVKVVILNHARDLHSGVRPFGPALRNSASGHNVEGWNLQANAMEVINSGATQSEPLQLIHDWMTSLNNGRLLTPIGSSDSHDVARHFVGQGRTYVRTQDDDPATIHIDSAISSLVQGQVMVSYGLLAELKVNGKYRSGELATLPDEKVTLQVRVLGPHWCQADKVLLFSNGELIREHALQASDRSDSPGVIAELNWDLPRLAYDSHLVAVAIGPGIKGLYWPTAKPYQPTSPVYSPLTFGCSGAVWLDGDGDGRRTPAIDYAKVVVARSGGELTEILRQLADYDLATAIQAAELWQQTGKSLLEPSTSSAIAAAAPHVREGFTRYIAAWRENQQSRQ